MLRKFFLTIVMSMILAGAAASDTPKPVLMVMGILIAFVVSVVPNRPETNDEKT